MGSRRRMHMKVVIIGFSLLAIYFIINNIFISKVFDNLRRECLNSNAAILGKLYEAEPEKIEEVFNLANEESLEKGLEILKDYGYDENLKMEYFSSLNDNLKDIKRNNLIMNFVMILAMLVIIALIVLNTERKIKILTKGVKETLNGNFNYDILKYEEGAYGELAFSFEDVRKRLKNNIEDANLKKDFLVDLLSDISHQLKTPIAALKIYNEILEDDTLSKEDKTIFIENSKIQITRMEWLVQNLLKLAKLDAGSVVFNMEDESIKKTITEAIDALREKIIEKNIKINVTESEIKVSQDSGWIKETFINIIKNAIEHSNENSDIDIILVDKPMYINVIIKDYGSGIEEDELPKVFNRFYKSKNNKSKESVGIGLSLAKSIIEGHGGIISAESKVGEGTSFTVILNKFL